MISTGKNHPSSHKNLANETDSSVSLARTREESSSAGRREPETIRHVSASRREKRPPSVPLPPLTPLGLLLALSRCWKMALTIGTPAAAVALVVAWLMIPCHYTSDALLRIAAREPRLVFQTAEGPSDFLTYRKTQIALIKSRFVLNAALRKPGIAELDTVREQQYPLQWLGKVIEVGSGESPEILRIALTGDRPEELAAIVNAVKDAYLDEVVLAERKERLSRLNDLERIFEQTENKVRQKEERVSGLAKELGSGDSKALTIKQQMALEYFADLQREHSRVRFELMRAQVNGSTKNSLPDEVDEASPLADSPDQIAGSGIPMPADPRVIVASRRITQLKELIARFERQVVDKDHPALMRYREELKNLEALVADGGLGGSLSPKGRQNRLELLKRQEKMLREEVEKYSQLVKNIGTSSYELESAQTEIGQIAKVSDRVGSEMEALRIELQSPPRVTLLQGAEIPQTRDVVRKNRLTSAAGFGIFGIVLLCTALLEFRAYRISQPKTVTHTLDLPLLGILPARPKRHSGLRLTSRVARNALWNNALIESVDSIRSILVHGLPEQSSHVLMVGSATAGEGKTTFACQLAGSLARSGRRTILVDGDLRRPRAHHLLGVELSPGLSDVLSGDQVLEGTIQETDEPNLMVLPAGRLEDSTLRTLAREGVSPIFDELRADYDFVIVDSSPLLYVADSATCVNDVDGIILTIRQDASRLPVVAAARDRLRMLDATILGAVMVGVSSNLQGYGYAYDYHYSYGVRS